VPPDPHADSVLLARIDQKVLDIGRQLDDFISTVRKSLDEHDKRIDALESAQARTYAYGAAGIFSVTVLWPIAKTLLHVS
jgi:hypothetical protein